MRSESLAQFLKQFSSSGRYRLTLVGTKHEFFEFIERHKAQLDCLILQDTRSLLPIANRLYEQGTLLPAVILATAKEQDTQEPTEQPSTVATDDSLDSAVTTSATTVSDPTEALATYIYHAGEVLVPATQIDQIERFIEQAITQFIELTPNYRLPAQLTTIDPTTALNAQNFLMLQQRRLAEKLKERLGYLGVYYKRNPRYFLRNLSRAEKQKFLEDLNSEYRQIILSYFTKDEQLNQKIDSFVNMTFLADVSVSQIVEIHMELMEQFAKSLKLEGRSEEVLLDYRLTLIDIIAHLCEMYRRSIPREL